MSEADIPEQEHDLLAATRQFAEAYQREENKKKFFSKLKKQYDADMLPVRATLMNLIHGPEEIFDANSSTQRFIRVFARHGIHRDFDYLEAYRAMIRMMRASEARQHALQDYRGQYNAYRRGRDEAFITGSILIGRNGRVPWFWHSSEQRLGPVSKTYQHEGFVILVEDRLYLLGIGKDYIRQMTLRAVPRPAETPIPGIVLTERTEVIGAAGQEDRHVPLAAKTVLFKASLDPARSEIEGYLRNQSEIDGVLYGWTRL